MPSNCQCCTILVKGACGGFTHAHTRAHTHTYHLTTLAEMMGPHEGAMEGEDSQELQR